MTFDKRQYMSAYRAANRERLRGYYLAYYAGHAERARMYAAAWRKANPDRVKALAVARDAFASVGMAVRTRWMSGWRSALFSETSASIAESQGSSPAITRSL